jgi:formate hydrogenlyase subunit 4
MEAELLPGLDGVNQEELLLGDMADNVAHAAVLHVVSGNLQLAGIVTVLAAFDDNVTPANRLGRIQDVKVMSSMLHAALRGPDEVL